MNATRSRWRGSMFAWILKTKPRNSGSSGATRPVGRASRGAGGGASATNASRNSSTPKLVTALPKKTGVSSPRAKPLRVEARRRRRRAARSPRAASRSASRRAARPACGSSRPSTLHRRAALRRARCARRGGPACARGRRRRGSRGPSPIGQFIGTRRMPSTVLDLVQQLERLAAGPVQLVDEGEDRDAAHAGRRGTASGLRLDALGAVDEHHGAVGRREGAVGVLAEVLVARGVEQVELSPSYSNWSTVEVIEMPRCCSIAIQSEVAWRWFLRARDRRRPAGSRRRRAAASRSASSCRRPGAR